MLRTLRIRDLAVVDDITLEFDRGLNLLTGETGAGKSIVVGALGLVAGTRADRHAVRSGAERAVVEALFEVGSESPVAAWVGAHGLEPIEDGQLLVRREIAVSGTGRAFVNGSPITQGLLRDVGRLLVDLHGQHDHVRLLEGDRQVELLDRYGECESAASAVADAFATLARTESELTAWRERLASKDDRLAELKRLLREVDAVGPRDGESEQLDRERRLLRSAGSVASGCQEILDSTRDGEDSVTARLTRATRRAAELAEIDPSLGAAVERFRSAAIEVADVAAEFEALARKISFEPGRLELLEERSAALAGLCRRHATDEAGLLALKAAWEAELGQLDDVDSAGAVRESAVSSAARAYDTAAATLSERRRNAAHRLSDAVTDELAAIAMSGARFEIRLDPRVTAGGAVRHRRGREIVDFMLAANPGEPARALATAASGGELSRLLLALHVVLGPVLGADVAVFDEIDAGVGGTVAFAIGARLSGVARGGQVVCVSHLPQIAAWADRHLRVAKSVTSGRSQVRIEALESSERVEEIARMLAGRRATESSRQHARELLRTTEDPDTTQSRRRA